MNLDHLKKNLFGGYNKTSVYQYIMTMEAEFSTQLIKKDEQKKQEMEQYVEKIRQLEQELETTKKQMELQKKEQDMIAFTMIEAKRYAESLKKETEESEKKKRELWNEKMQKKEKELNEYDLQIKQIRDLFGKLLHALDGQAKEVEQQLQKVKDACPNKGPAPEEKKS